jgi:hypothetical protein
LGFLRLYLISEFLAALQVLSMFVLAVLMAFVFVTWVLYDDDSLSIWVTVVPAVRANRATDARQNAEQKQG